jgi:hypothetical protein
MASAPGIALNNPGHIRHGRSKWVGMSIDQTDQRFVRFDTPQQGIAAIAKLLITYSVKYNLVTIDGLIKRYAPPDDNNPTDKYVQNVCNWTGFDSDQELDVDSYEVMSKLVPAIIRQEVGLQASERYKKKLIDEALALANVHGAVRPGFNKLKIAAASTTALGIVADQAEPAKKLAGSLAVLTGSPIVQHIATLALTVAGVAVLADWLLDRRKAKQGR